jgi:hypothetical protein
MILVLKRTGDSQKTLVNTEFVAVIKPQGTGAKIVLSGVDSGEKEQFVVETVEDILSIMKNERK